MRSVNSITLTGILGQDPEYRFFQDGKEMMTVRFCWGTSSKPKDGHSGFNWIDLKWFRPIEGIKPYLVKGKNVGITGRLDIETWEDKNGGGKRSKPVILVHDIVLLNNAKDEGGQVPLVPKTQPAEGQTTIPLDQGDQAPF